MQRSSASQTCLRQPKQKRRIIKDAAWTKSLYMCGPSSTVAVASQRINILAWHAYIFLRQWQMMSSNACRRQVAGHSCLFAFCADPLLPCPTQAEDTHSSTPNNLHPSFFMKSYPEAIYCIKFVFCSMVPL